MSINAYIEKINELEERLEDLERKYKGSVCTTMLLLSYLHPEQGRGGKVSKQDC